MPGTRESRMPRLARLGATAPLGTAMLANWSGRRSTMSCSALRNASQRGCGSSRMEISTRGDERQALALVARQRLLRRGVVGRRRGGVVLLAVGRARLEDHLRGALPEREPVGAGADRVLADLVAVVLVDLARDRAREVAVREVVEEVVVGLLEAHLEGVAVERAQALDRRVVVHAVLAPRLGEHLVHAGDVALEQVEVGRLLLRVEEPLDRVDVVLGDELALLALEGRRRRRRRCRASRACGRACPPPCTSGIASSVFGISFTGRARKS